MTKRDNNQAFSELYLSKALEGEVKAWADQGWHGVTQTTLELMNFWFGRDDESGEKFHHCQRSAIETIIYCHEILKEPNLGKLFERIAPEALLNHLLLEEA